MSLEEQADVRRRAVPVIAAYRDAGCQPPELSDELLDELMAFLGCRPVEGRLAAMMLRGPAVRRAPTRERSTGATRSPTTSRQRSPVVVIGCGESGILAGIRLAQAGLPFTIVDKNDGPGGTWWENRYPGARVDVGSHQYCYSFEPADHWSEYYCRQPELRDYFVRIVEKYGLRPHCRFGHHRHRAALGRRPAARGGSGSRTRTAARKCSTAGSSSAPSGR